MVVKAGSRHLSLKERLLSIDEAEAASTIFGIHKIPCVISSPFRDDKIASFSVRFNKSGKLTGHDFATGEHFSLVDMVMKARDCDFKTAAELLLNGEFGKYTSDAVSKPKPATPSKLDVVVREWNNEDIKFWESFGISLDWCKFGSIYPVSGIVFHSDGYTRDMLAEKYAYAFVTFFKDERYIKVYQPFSKSRKWQRDGDGITQVWNLLDKIPDKGENIIITSSLKDALCLWANTGVPSCCPQSESVNLDEEIVTDLKSRFVNVWVFFDNDYKNPNNPGQTSAERMCAKFDLKNICIDQWYECKDPSDLYKKYGRKPLIKTLQNHNLCIETTIQKTEK